MPRLQPRCGRVKRRSPPRPSRGPGLAYTSRVIELAQDILFQEATIRFYGVRLQTRMTVVRLTGGRLFVHSPIRLDPDLRRAIDALGHVAYVVSPNKLHSQALAQWAEAWPESVVLAPPGLPERRPDLRFDGVLGDEPHPGWEGELEQVVTRGNVFLSEVLFFHRVSRTLIVGDLIENLDEHTASRFGRLLAALFGVGAEPVASPELRLYTTDAAAADASLRRAERWGFERIVLAHGALIHDRAHEVFRAVREDLVRRVERRGPLARKLFAALARLQ